MEELFRQEFDSPRLHLNYSNKTIYKRFQKKQVQRIRVNEWIRISPLRVIDEKGENLGIIERDKALALARAKGLDLIEIAPSVRPPVCKIMDYGKYQYQKSREEKEKKSKQKKIEIKGVRIGLGTGKHDLEIKAKQTEKFLNKDYKVKVDMILRGREKALLDVAKEKLNQFIEMIPIQIKIEQEPKKQPRGLTVVIGKER